MHSIIPWRALLPLLLVPLSSPAATGTRVTVEAGAYDRRQTVVEFTLPKNVPAPVALQRDGRVYPLQVDDRGRAMFILDKLGKGETARFDLQPSVERSKSPSNVSARRNESRIEFNLASVDGQPGNTNPPALSYQAEPAPFPRDNIKPLFRRAGYLHPIRTPSGRLVTDDFPANHLHHHGVWWSWTKTEFQGRTPDFWNMGDGKGRVDVEGVDQPWSGPVHGGFHARHRYVDLTAQPPVTALLETWTVVAYAPSTTSASAWMFDVDSEQRCRTSDALKLPEYRYGGIGLRGNWAWNGATNMTFLTSEGETDREKGNATRGRWCDMSGPVDGQIVGIAVFCHPGNYRFPQPMRLHPTEPFFNFAPQQAGDMAIQPGETFRARYRFVVHDGPANAGELDRLWNDYAHPPVATVAATVAR